jgi:hypothetical protein
VDLAEELLIAGAPLELAERATDAAADELEHTRACAQLASRWIGTPVRPALPRYARRPALTGDAAVQRLAVESWTDGCMAEGIAARQAAHAARIAREPDAERLQHRIASDERRHAELAWSILEWVAKRGRDGARDAIWAAAAEASAVEGPTPGLERFGRVGRARGARADRA